MVPFDVVSAVKQDWFAHCRGLIGMLYWSGLEAGNYLELQELAMRCKKKERCNVEEREESKPKTRARVTILT